MPVNVALKDTDGAKLRQPKPYKPYCLNQETTEVNSAIFACKGIQIVTNAIFIKRLAFLNGTFTASFSLFSTVNSKTYSVKNCQRLDSNSGPLDPKATALSTEPLLL